MGFLRRLFGRDIKTDTAVQNGYTLVADDTKTSGIDWSDVLVRGGLGRDLADGINYSADMDATITPGKYSFDGSTAGDTPGTAGNFEVRERNTTIFQVAQTDDNELLSRTKVGVGAWSAWKELADAGTVTNYQRVVLTGSGTFTVPAGITSLKVTAVSGGLGEVDWTQGSQGFRNGCLYIQPQPGQATIRTISVTPGDAISYICGTGQSFSFIDLGSGYAKLREISAGSTGFGTEVLVDPPLARFAISHTSVYGYGVLGSKVHSGYFTSILSRGRLPRGLVVENTAYPYLTSPPVVRNVAVFNTNSNNTNSVPIVIITGMEPLFPYIESTPILPAGDEVELWMPSSTSSLSAGDPGYIIVEYA